MNDKDRFRRKKVWKDFRSQIIKARGARCELCGIKKTARGLDVHHLTPDAYTVLEHHRFKILCAGCHEFVERMVFRVATMPRRDAFLEWAGEFISRKGLT
jgi:predicted HNH restriction endonuclease